MFNLSNIYQYRYISHLLIAISGLLLSACMAGVFVAGGLAGTAIIDDTRSIAVVNQDHAITRQVANGINASEFSSNQAKVNVYCYNRVLLLVGQVDSNETKDQIISIAKNAVGVRRIFDEITISKPISALETSDDIFITSKIKGKVLANRDLKSGQFLITTNSKVVYILGIATRRQAEIVSDIASNTGGVKKVVKMIEYIEQ